MPKLADPKRFGVHRFACLSLYRALLRQCRHLPGEPSELASIKPLIHDRFHRYRKLQSPTQIVHTLKAGYEALDLIFSAAQGQSNATQRLKELLVESRSRIEAQKAFQRQLYKPPQQVSEKAKRKAELKRFMAATSTRHPDATPILSRPRPVVVGTRRVPKFVSARGVPFIRIKKPQSKFLSDVLRAKLEQRWARIERRDRLRRELLFASDEDEWDTLTSVDMDEESWASEVQNSLTEVVEKLRIDDQKNMELAEAMWKVVLAERELAAKEEEQRKRL